MLILAALAVLMTWPFTGCQLVGFVGSSVYRAGSTQVKAKYTGLTDRNFAVIVAADRAIQADFPDVVGIVTSEITRRVADPKNNPGANGIVAPEDVLRFQYQFPGWIALSPAELVAKLGVDRLIYVDMQEFRLTDPGNPYLWNGRASASISVIEAENDLGAVAPFREFVTVRFPDNDSTSPNEIPSSTVQLVLLKRFVDRASWLFFDHEESNIIEY